MTNASAKPPGPVENDVTSENVETCNKLKKGFNDPTPLRDLLVTTFNVGQLESPLNSLYSEGNGAMFFCKIKLNAKAIAECKDEASSSGTPMLGDKPIGPTTYGSTPMWGDSGGFFTFVGAKVPGNGEAIATYCLVRQKGAWKVHCGFISAAVLGGDDLKFITGCLADFAKKQ